MRLLPAAVSDAARIVPLNLLLIVRLKHALGGLLITQLEIGRDALVASPELRVDSIFDGGAPVWLDVANGGHHA